MKKTAIKKTPQAPGRKKMKQPAKAAVAAKLPGKKVPSPKPSKTKGKPAAKASSQKKAGGRAKFEPPQLITSEVPCNICGGTQFKAGPNGRLSTTQKPPVCAGCGTLERHRVYRNIFDKIRSPAFNQYACLSFNKDRSIASGWFKSVTVTSPENNPLDVEALSLPDESVDVVVCNHVLGGVRDYERALKELARVTSRKGFAFISFGNPHFRQQTDDWGFSDPKRHGLYRSFGADIEDKLRAIVPGVGIARLVGEDPATGTEDRAYVLTRNLELLSALGERGLKVRFLHF